MWFLVRLARPTPSKRTLTFACSFAKLLRDFGETLPIHRPQPYQQEERQRKSKHQGPWCLALANLTFGSLAAAFGIFFLGFQKATLGSNQRQVQGCASGPWYLAVAKPHLWKGKCPVPSLPDPWGAGGGSPLQGVYLHNNDSQCPTVAELSPKTCYFRELWNNRKDSHYNTNGLRNYNSLSGP